MGCQSETKLMAEKILFDSLWCERVKIHNILYIFFFLAGQQFDPMGGKGPAPPLEKKNLDT